MEKRLNENKHDCTVEVYTYEHGTHFVFSQSLMKMMLPIGHNLFVKLAFADANKFPKNVLQLVLILTYELEIQLTSG